VLNYLKAIVACLIAFVGSLVTATIDGSGITVHEWLAAILAGLVSLGAVFGVPNLPNRKGPL
jgi:hypothetical protein